MKITLNPPSEAQLAAARRTLARAGVVGDSAIVELATYGTADNPRRLMIAAGRVAMSLPCRASCGRRLDPSDKDALGVELCPVCFEGAGLENEHSDYGHAEPVAGCPSCADDEAQR